METEIWKPIKDFEGFYEVSNLTNVRSVTRIEPIRNSKRYKDFNRIRKGMKMRKQNRNGYYSIILVSDTLTRLCKVSRLVAQAFVPNPDKKLFVNHIDGNKLNDLPNNLEWCTASENMRHAYRVLKIKHGAKDKFGSASRCAKKVVEMDLNGDKIKTWDSLIEAAEKFSKNRNSCGIVMCCKGQRNKAHNRTWKYAQ